MRRRDILIAATVAALLPGLALADRMRLTGQEIETLLAGNTIIGDWHGTPYKQFFDTDGYTLYQTKSKPGENGRWRVNKDLGAYESWWPTTDWTRYYIEREGDRFFWFDAKDGQPFTVVPGRQVSW